jgi:hypothetical protein
MRARPVMRDAAVPRATPAFVRANDPADSGINEAVKKQKIEDGVDELEAIVHRLGIILRIEFRENRTERVGLEKCRQSARMMPYRYQAPLHAVADELLEGVGETGLRFFEPRPQFGSPPGAGDHPGAIDAIDVATAQVDERSRRLEGVAQIGGGFRAPHHRAHRSDGLGNFVFEFLGQCRGQQTIPTAIAGIDRTFGELLGLHEVLEPEPAFTVAMEQLDRGANDRIGVGRAARGALACCHTPTIVACQVA